MQRREALICALIALATLAVYAQAGSFEFVQFDDNEYVYANPMVRDGLSREGVAGAFLQSHAANWHPVTWLSHMLDVELFGLNAGRHHLVSVAMHIANALLLFVLLRMLTGSSGRSAFVAALFALHPLNVESVAWISERKNVLSTLFWLLTTIAWTSWVRRQRPSMYAATLALFAAGLMAKPMLVSLPLTLLVLDVWPLRRPLTRRLVVEKIPLFALAAISAAVTWLAQSSWKATASFAFGDRLMNATISYAWYLGKTIWPTGLSAYYPHPASFGARIAVIAFVLSLLLLIAISAFAWKLRAKHPHLLAGWAWFLITLLPVIGIVQVGLQARADRYAYIPLIGIFIMIVFSFPARARSIGIVALLLLAFAGWRQAATWRDSEKLFRHAVTVSDRNWVAWTGLGVAYLDRNEFDRAGESLDRAIAVAPRFPPALYNAGFARVKAERYAEAIPLLRAATAVDPEYTEAWAQLGVSLMSLERIDESLPAFERALALNPDHPLALYGMTLGCRLRDRPAESASFYARLQRASPELAADFDVRVGSVHQD